MRLYKYIEQLYQFDYEKDLELLPIGDTHIGNAEFDEPLLKKYLDYVKEEPNRFITLMGDEIHALQPSSSGKYGYEQIMTIDEQLDKLYELLEPLDDRILAKCNSTHTGWLRKRSTYDLDREIARHLGAEYVGAGNYWNIKAGDQLYTIYQSHGVGSSKYPQYLLNKSFNNYPDADVHLIGHIHKLYAKPFNHEISIGNKRFRKYFWGIRTGCFVGTPEWAKEKFFDHPDLGAPIIYFDDKVKEIRARVDLDG